MITNNPKKLKHITLTKRIKRIFIPAKGRNAHKMYPEAYYQPQWLSHKHYDIVQFVADAKRITRKAAAEQLIEDGFRRFMHDNLMKSISDPQSREEIADATRLRLAIRRLCRECGWDVNKLI